MTALAGESQEIFMLTIRTFHPGKAVVQVSAFQVAVNDLLKVRTPEPVGPFEPLLVDSAVSICINFLTNISWLIYYPRKTKYYSKRYLR